jgi:hypothetical protein
MSAPAGKSIPPAAVPRAQHADIAGVAKGVKCAHGPRAMKTEQVFGNRLVTYQHVYQSRCVRQLLEGEEPALGAHLVTPWRGFAHHGIYLGAGRVIHYNARMYRLNRRPVEETDMREFAEGRAVFEVSHAEGTCETDEVIRRARSRLGEDQYHLFNNNCEHLVEWCLHGVARSFQVESVLDFPQRAGEWWIKKLFALACRLIGVRRTGLVGEPVKISGPMRKNYRPPADRPK